MKTTITIPSAGVLLAAILPLAGASAQNLLSYYPNGAASHFTEDCAASPVWNPALAGPGVPVGNTPSPARPLLGHPQGACAVDNLTGVVYSTNGSPTIHRKRYERLGCPPGGGALPPLVLPAFIGQVTGLAVDPATKNLFVTDGITIWRLDPLAGMAILCSFPAAPMNILAGLDFDPATPNVLYAITTAAEFVRYNLCAGFINFVPPPYPWPGAVATGLAIDKSQPGATIYVLHANGEIWNFSTGTMHLAGHVDHVGLTFLASPTHLPSAGSCGGVKPEVRASTLAVAGVPSGVDLCNIPAGTATVYALVGFGFGGPIAIGGGFWLPGAPIALAIATGGAASVNLPVPALANGARYYVQWAVPCAGAALGVIFSDAIQVEVAR
jgi:hypothetical protein